MQIYWPRRFVSGANPPILSISRGIRCRRQSLSSSVTPHVMYPEVGQFKVSKSKDKTYGIFISTYMGSEGTPVSREEHIRFLALWLCRYIFCSRSVQVTYEYFNLAIAIADGKILNFSSSILAFLYRCLYELVLDPTSSPFGPLWLLQLWLYLYFPHLRPQGHRLEDLSEAPFCCRFVPSKVECSDFRTYFEFFYVDHPTSQPVFTNVVERLPNRSWFIVCQESNEPDPSYSSFRRVVWANCLVTRDLVVGFCPIEGFTKKSKLYCELYAANLLAR